MGGGEARSPIWLDTAGLHGHLLGHEPLAPADSRRAAQHYAALVHAGRQARLWDEGLRHQIYLGNDLFVKQMQALTRELGLSVSRVSRLIALAEAERYGADKGKI